MEKSISIRIAGILHVMPQWWYTVPFWKVGKINKKVTSLIKEKNRNFDYRREYIEKANGKKRPLGVPTIEWRIYLHILNYFLAIFLENQLLKEQHAYMPGKGTMTAWASILKKVIQAKYIYETDLKGFFNEVSTNTIQRKLSSLGMPWETMDILIDMNYKAPKAPCRGNWDESDPVVRHSMILKNPSRLLWRWRNAYRSDSSISPGVAQGSPISPLLSLLTLPGYLKQQKHINYADDQIFYGDQNFTIRDDPFGGIIHAPEKCGWIKFNGEWIKEFKFLGMIWKGEKGELWSKTRKGISIQMPGKLKNIWKMLYGLNSEIQAKEISKLKMFGFVQACLYRGYFSVIDKIAEESHIGKPHAQSWMGKYVMEFGTETSTAVRSLAHLLKYDKLTYSSRSDILFNGRRSPSQHRYKRSGEDQASKLVRVA